MRPRSLLEASVVVLAALLAWWGGIGLLDDALAAAFPYRRYEMLAA